MKVVLHPNAAKEKSDLPTRERVAMSHAEEKLEALGDRLAFPHSSDIRGSISLRELRPRGGRSPWRAFYRRVGSVMVIAAVGPEAEVDPQGFRRAVRRATQRLAQIQEVE